MAIGMLVNLPEGWPVTDVEQPSSEKWREFGRRQAADLEAKVIESLKEPSRPEQAEAAIASVRANRGRRIGFVFEVAIEHGMQLKEVRFATANAIASCRPEWAGANLLCWGCGVHGELVAEMVHPSFPELRSGESLPVYTVSGNGRLERLETDTHVTSIVQLTGYRKRLARGESMVAEWVEPRVAGILKSSEVCDAEKVVGPSGAF